VGYVDLNKFLIDKLNIYNIYIGHPVD